MTRFLPFVLTLLIGLVRCDRSECGTEQVNTCIRLADPLLQPQHVFPVNSQDIDHVCNVLFPQTWSKFVECIKDYTNTCLSSDQKSELNRAVGDSINSVHKMCTNEDYKSDYLRHAECIKEKSMNPSHCGNYYTTMVDMVKGDSPALHREICCSHNSFKECVIAETESCPCTGDACLRGMEATGFAKAMLDKALGFLLKQCKTYTPDERDCAVYTRPQVKQPRVEETDKNSRLDDIKYDDGSYFPSGMPNRDERREDEWTDLQEDLLQPIDNVVDEKTTEFPDLLDPVPRETTNNPVFEPFMPQQPQEDERRKPWLPSPDIKSFDDIFNTVTRRSEAQERASGGTTNTVVPVLAFLSSIILLLI